MTMPAAPLDWNVVVTAYERTGSELRCRSQRLTRLRATGFRNLYVARVDDPMAFLESTRTRRRCPWAAVSPRGSRSEGSRPPSGGGSRRGRCVAFELLGESAESGSSPARCAPVFPS